MGLSGELRRGQFQVPHPVPPRVKCALEREAEAVALAFDGAGKEPKPPSQDILEVVRRMVGNDGSGVARLGRRELRMIPYLVWGTDASLRNSRLFLRGYLARVDALWPRGTKRIWRHYLVNFDASSTATKEVASWLSGRLDTLPDAVGGFTREYQLLEVDQAASVLARAVLDSNRLVEEIERLGFSLQALRSSPLMASILEAAGKRLGSMLPIQDAPDRLTRLLDGDATDAFEGMKCSDELAASARRSLIDGLVGWQARASSAPEPTVDFLLALNRDPRFWEKRWVGRVDDRSKEAMEQWLSRKTVEAFFRVINTLKTDRPDMWRARRSFWSHYLQHLSKAWLITGKNAEPIAKREQLDFGSFVAGPETLAEHCGLLMQIRRLCILEMNKDGAALLWSADNEALPRPYERTYSRREILDGVRRQQVTRIVHNGYWEARLSAEILKRTGINVRV